MKKIFILPIIAAALLVSCKSKSTTTAPSNKTVGTSTSVTGQKKITESMLAEGKTIFENSCGKCHDLPDPKKYTDEKWVKIMNTMAPKAKLNAKQSELVYDYATFNN